MSFLSPLFVFLSALSGLVWIFSTALQSIQGILLKARKRVTMYPQAKKEYINSFLPVIKKIKVFFFQRLNYTNDLRKCIFFCFLTTMTYFFSKQFLKMAMQLKYAIKVIIVQSSNLLVVLEPYQLNLYIQHHYYAAGIMS